MLALAFILFAAMCCLYAALMGGRDGKIAAGLLVGATLLTIPADELNHHWIGTQYGVMAVDTLLAAALFIFALSSRRWWPVWMAGFSLVSVSAHLASMITSTLTFKLYAATATFWALPILLVMVGGIWLDRRARK